MRKKGHPPGEGGPFLWIFSDTCPASARAWRHYEQGAERILRCSSILASKSVTLLNTEATLRTRYEQKRDRVGNAGFKL